jgi:hypothetical protein
VVDVIPGDGPDRVYGGDGRQTGLRRNALEDSFQ